MLWASTTGLSSSESPIISSRSKDSRFRWILRVRGGRPSESGNPTWRSGPFEYDAKLDGGALAPMTAVIFPGRECSLLLLGTTVDGAATDAERARLASGSGDGDVWSLGDILASSSSSMIESTCRRDGLRPFARVAWVAGGSGSTLGAKTGGGRLFPFWSLLCAYKNGSVFVSEAHKVQPIPP